MLSPQLRRKVLNLWTMFWSGGITNPLTAIEQITYLLFLKHLEILDARRVELGKPSIYEGNDFCRWSNIRRDPSYDLLSQTVFPWLRGLDETLLRLNNGNEGTTKRAERIMEDAYFQLPPEKSSMLQEAVKTIDDLFSYDPHSDLMGDIFEYLLSEIKTAGKNGQFRTPRHIIRFMVDLVDPQPGERIVDPAAGTGGFLFSSIQHLRQEITPSGNLRIEWDGTPHRLGGPGEEEILQKTLFTGYDNDRTMVRVGWMNMILHGIEDPRIQRRDSLGKNLPDSESEKYDVVLANPPFTGNVDYSDLHERRFLQGGLKNKPFTNKSELLFLALFMDLLAVGGRAAVIVPEGVLFGSTNAHRELRRRLLFEHDLRAIISLPAGVFQPYSGVKTSILMFHKRRGNTDPALKPGDPPQTEAVFFYEVLADGYSLDARRSDLPHDNDLPDAVVKFISRSDRSDEYFQPRLYSERWRLVSSDETLKIFPELVNEEGQTYGIHELFRQEFERFKTLEGDPDLEGIASHVVSTQSSIMLQLFVQSMQANIAEVRTAARGALLPEKARQLAEEKLTLRLREIRKTFSDAARDLLDSEFEQHGRRAFDPALDSVYAQVENQISEWVKAALGENELSDMTDLPNLYEQVTNIVREFAKLDGYDVLLRTLQSNPVPSEANRYASLRSDNDPEFEQERYVFEARSWLAPVRIYSRNDEWQNSDGSIINSHTADGSVRPEYLDWLRAENKFNDGGTINDRSLLDPNCIEANDLNLSAGRYKPFLHTAAHYPPPVEIIEALEKHEHNILDGLARLKAMVGGEE
jgi:type I restriction enzyme M protein